MSEPPQRDDEPRKRGRLIELVLLFGLAPIALYALREPFGPLLLPTLGVAAVTCGWVLWRDPTFDRSCLWRLEGIRPHLLRSAWWFAAGGTLTIAIVLLWFPDLWLEFPRERPVLFVLIVVFYPLVSAWPQELVYRAFFLHRYAPLIRNPLVLEITAALAFGWAHLLFASTLALVLSTVGGWLFLRTFVRSRSLIAASVEHGAWGVLLFTVGLGRFFYAGSV